MAEDTKVYETFNNLWSFHNKKQIDVVRRRLVELKTQGQYYDEINMPEVSKIITGLLQDIEVLKKAKVELMNKIKET